MIKFADRFQVSSTGTSAASLTLGAAATGCRTLAQCIADGDLAINDTIYGWADDGAGNWEASLFTVASTTVVNRLAVVRSSAGGTTPATFSGSALTVFNEPPAAWLSKLLTAVQDTSGATVGLVGPDGKTVSLKADVAGRASAGNTVAKSIYSYTPAQYAYPGRFLHYAALRRKFIVRNPATNTATMQVAPVSNSNLNNNANAPSSGWIDLAPGYELTESFTARQWYVRAKAVAPTALASSSTTATATLAAHGFTTGEYLEINGAVPTGFNGTKQITVVDANTFTYTVASGLAAVTTLPTVATVSQYVEVETEVTL